MSERKNTLTTRFVKPHDYRTVSVDGIFGGFNTMGKLNLNFYIDTIGIPDQITLNVNPISNVVTSQSPIKYNNDAVKEIPFTISMDYDLSKQVLNWLTDQIKNFEKANQHLLKK